VVRLHPVFFAALPMSLVVLVLLDRELRAPSLRLKLGLAALVALLAFTHFFVLTVTLGLAAVVLLNRWREAGVGRVLRAALPLPSGPAVMAQWFWARLAAAVQGRTAASWWVMLVFELIRYDLRTRAKPAGGSRCK
jgi:hypothetical protein